jgi:hypothetical protein
MDSQGVPMLLAGDELGHTQLGQQQCILPGFAAHLAQLGPCTRTARTARVCPRAHPVACPKPRLISERQMLARCLHERLARRSCSVTQSTEAPSISVRTVRSSGHALGGIQRLPLLQSTSLGLRHLLRERDSSLSCFDSQNSKNGKFEKSLMLSRLRDKFLGS